MQGEAQGAVATGELSLDLRYDMVSEWANLQRFMA